MSDELDFSIAEKQKLVTEARETFGASVARELWVKLGLPKVTAATSEAPVGRLASRGDAQFAVRLPDDLRERLKRAAAVNRRSMNTEIVFAIEDWLGPREGMTMEDASSVGAQTVLLGTQS